MYQIIFIYIMLTNDPYEYVLFLDVIVHIYAEKPNKFNSIQQLEFYGIKYNSLLLFTAHL